MFSNLTIRLTKFIHGYKATKFCNHLENQLKANGIEPKKVRLEKREYFNKINSVIKDIDYETKDLIVFIAHQNSFKEAYENLKILREAINLDLQEFLNFKRASKLLIKGDSVDFFLQIAREFKNYKLEENSQGNYKQLVDSVKIPKEHIAKIVEVMIYTKNAGCPLEQKKIIKFYDSNRPLSEDLNSLKEAWIFYNERIKKRHNFPVDISDLAQAVKYNRNPKTFVVDFNRILENDLGIPFERYRILDMEESKISDLLSLIIKAKFANIYLDFEIVYNDLKVVDVWQVIRYLIRFIDSGFRDFDYEKLRNFHLLKGDLEKLHRAYLYNRQKNIVEEKLLYESVLEIIVVKNQNLNFDPIVFLVAIELASLFNITFETVKNDYLAGHDVFNLLNNINFAKKNDIILDYNNAKFIEKSCAGPTGDQTDCFKKVIQSALNPVLLEGESFLVTTKDNIEIKANMMIEAVLNLNNYFTGSDHNMLLQRASIIFIDEIQRKYNHDEIIINIEKISNNILDRLHKETRTQKTDYIDHDEMIKIKVEHHSAENKEKSEEKSHETTEEKQETDGHQTKTVKNIMARQSDNEKEKFINTSKYYPRRVIIPKIEFVKDTFKEYEKEKEKFEIHKMQEEAKIEKLKAEIELKKAWAKSNDLKYLILKDDEQPPLTGGH